MVRERERERESESEECGYCKSTRTGREFFEDQCYGTPLNNLPLPKALARLKAEEAKWGNRTVGPG